MQIDWLAKLRFFLQTMAFCLAISAIQYAFQPERSYEAPLVYSVCIGAFTWVLIDFGRHLIASSVETGWPRGPAALGLPIAGIIGGYFLGTLAGDWWFGWSSWSAEGRSQLPASVLVTLLAGGAVTYYFYSRNRSSYLQSQMSQARRLAAQARLKLLETQLEPHMLFNTLANLRVLIGSDPQRAQVMLDHIIAYLRATLDGSRSSSHSLQVEFDRVRDYLELMAVRMGPRLSYQLELPADLAGHPVPALLLQPLVENAIKHGLEPKIEGGTISVQASRAGAALALEVRDTGVGLATAGDDGKGFGLAQVRERLAAAFDGHASVEFIAGLPVGTGVRLTLPLAASGGHERP